MALGIVGEAQAAAINVGDLGEPGAAVVSQGGAVAVAVGNAGQVIDWALDKNRVPADKGIPVGSAVLVSDREAAVRIGRQSLEIARATW